MDNINESLRRAGAVVEPFPAVTVDHFYAHLPSHSYIFIPDRSFWPASSIDSQLPKIEGEKASAWLDQNRCVHAMVWAPGLPMIINDRIAVEGGWIDHPGARTFNRYVPPPDITGDPSAAQLWRDHLRRLYGEEADHIERWLAHRVQRPHEKLNHALVLGGGQGIGKDTLLEPVKHAVGAWNVSEVSPSAMLGRFNGWCQAVIVRVSEARDLGDVDRYSFYDHAKTYIAAPPDVLMVDAKNTKEFPVANVLGVVFTTNDRLSALYLPPDDRRHFVAWSEVTRDAFGEGYWRRFYAWYAAGGLGHTAAYLRALDLSGFDPKAPPPRTEAWHHLVMAGAPAEEGDLAEHIARLGTPTVLTVNLLAETAARNAELVEMLTDRRTRRTLPHRMGRAGYVPFRNDGARDGLWVIDGRRVAVYRHTLATTREAAVAARHLPKVMPLDR
jgi:hypothetical protein